MSLKVLIAPDKFKGTLTAKQAAECMARGWRRARPDDTLELLPTSDGGDGFGEILGALLGASVRLVDTLDAAHRPVQAQWLWQPQTRTAIVESAKTIGLALLPPGQFHPFGLDTFGLGAVLAETAASGARRCLVGIGGSATNDGGFGLARALGWEFFNERGQALQHWTELHELSRIRSPQSSLRPDELLVAVDVQNPLLGPSGCTRVFGPQKGLRAEEFPQAERCLARLAEVAQRHLHRASADEPGAGAAGGLGFGLRTFLGARLEPGFALFAQYAELPRRLESAQLVLTGEGAIDASTLMGKGVGELALACEHRKLPCVGLAGIVAEGAKNARCFARLHAIAPDLTSPEQAMAQPALWLECLATRAAEQWR
jgi:glycerate kinase